MATWPKPADFSLWPYALQYAMQFYYIAPVLEDSFWGTQAGTSMKVQFAFKSSIFALQNSISTGNSTLGWSPHMQPGLKCIPDSISLGRTYQVTTHTIPNILPKYQFSLHYPFTSIHHTLHDVTKYTIQKQQTGPCRSTTPHATKET
jgi:hypothetical protein